MHEQVTRRSLLKASLAASAATGLPFVATPAAVARDYGAPVLAARGLTAYQNGSNILLRLNNLPLLGYRAHPSLKYPYFYPLSGPVSGLPLTSESALPYPHHRSLWLGCEPLNGGDYWSDGPLDKGQIRSVELALLPAAPAKKSVTFTNRCEWVRKQARSPLGDERRYVITLLNDRVRLIDCWLKLTAREDIVVTNAKHSFFALRAAADVSPAYGGVLINSEGGLGAKGTYGKEAAWCGYHGARAQHPRIVEGIALMNHPDNFDGVCPWFTRDYGNLSPSPFSFLKRPWKLDKGASAIFQYRVVLHAGDPKDAGLDALYRQWLAKQAQA